MNRLRKFLSWVSAVAAFLLCYAGYSSENLAMYLAGLCICAVMFVIYGLHDRARRKLNAEKPITTVDASVVGHRIAQEKAGSKHIIRYYITFRPADGSPNCEFEVSQLDFEDFDVNETGPLRYRGWEFLSFGVKDKSDFKPMAPLAEEYEAKPEPTSRIQKLAHYVLTLWQKMRTKPAQHEVDMRADDNGILTHELEE